MPSSGLGAYQVKIHQIVFGGLFFLIVLMGVRAMMSGGAGNLKMLAALSVSVGVVLALDKYYWVLGPLLFSSGLRMPGLPFDGKELGCILLIGVYFESMRSISFTMPRLDLLFFLRRCVGANIRCYGVPSGA